MSCRSPIRLVAHTVVMLLPLLAAGQTLPQIKSTDLKSITISFKFDPGATYGGVRWVSPPFTTGMQVGQVTVDAKAQGLDSNGKLVAIKTEWTPSDPEMVSVTPVRDDEFRITVKHAGEGKLRVSAQQTSRELLITAKPLGNGKAMQVQFSVVSPEPRSSATVQGETKTETLAPEADGLSPFNSAQEKQSYALGINTASQLRSRAIDVDVDLFMQAFKDTIAGGKLLLTDQEVRAVIINLRLEQKKKHLALKQEKRTAGQLNEIKISFKQLPQPDASAGESWISPASYTVAQDTVLAKAQGLFNAGSVTDINPTWTPADPEMVAVSPTEGNAVAISVKRPGESKVIVAAKGTAKELTIRAKQVAGAAIQMEIRQ
jgi:Domain amino terminal to FKBP-type peptidyl-prolyl isomerase